jgi:hypothetical protein
MVLQVFAYAGQVVYDLDAVMPEKGLRSDTRQLQQL